MEKLCNGSFREVRKSFLRWFRTYGVPEEIASDGGPPFNAYEYKRFLQTLGVESRLISAYYPQSNGRAEAAVKSAKRIIRNNIDPVTGNLNTDSAAKAIMLHRNTPTQDTGIAPSVMLFGRPLRDHLPQMKRVLRTKWSAIADAREMALAKRVLKPTSSPHDKRELHPLEIGDSVQIQNQTGAHPNKWSNTGVVSEVLPYRQYNVVVDGSRRVTLRNRKFLRQINPVTRKDFRFPDVNTVEHTDDASGSTEPIEATDIPVGQVEAEIETPPQSTVPPQQSEPLRRSARTWRQPTRLVVKTHGKTHGEE